MHASHPAEMGMALGLGAVATLGGALTALFISMPA